MSAPGPSNSSSHSNPTAHRRHNPKVPASNIVPKPDPQTSSDPRTFELTQLQRRFNLTGSIDDGTTFTLLLKPSDPDFVYSIDILRLRLTVPIHYRSNVHEKPSIEVLNQEIPVGYRVNVERGFDELVEGKPGATLLNLMNALYRALEKILSGEKATTVKIVPNLTPVSRTPVLVPSPVATPPPPKEIKVEVRPAPPPPKPVAAPAPVVTKEQREKAAERRALETRQLESRLQLSSVFVKSSDGIEYVVPLEPRRKDLLPVPLQPLKKVRLMVPLSYDIMPARIEIDKGVPEVIREKIQKQFAKYLEENKQVSLIAALNILSARLHLWAVDKEDKKVELPGSRKNSAVRAPSPEKGKGKEKETEKEDTPPPTVNHDEEYDKSHIKVIPRPPEWSFPDQDSDGSDDEEYSDFEDEKEAEDAAGEKEAAEADGASHAIQEKGTSLSCPGIQMSGIELVEILSINVNIKCTRCKKEKEILGIKGSPPGMEAQPQAFRCEQCSEVIAIAFRKDFIHQNSHRLGFFDLTNCTITEILPSSFTPQCGGCSTPLPSPGMKDLVRGQSITANCRECHRKMGLYIPDFKLLRITQGENLHLKQLPLKSKKDKERYVAGTELPNKGRCKHYRKSTRWFRFSCCSKVHPCDRCHDEAENHPSEHANRMICGLCSREQNYRPEDCRFCGNSFFAKKLSHYWEGGKGTRDKRLMARNDPRKYKRLGKPTKEEA
ncbi:hypothetical protein FPQ18DRAFT_262903 [Pyronema domesticum]|nr:hypothetical protein FPQ18DRAFT_262903 [Pyronema domesticum]